MAELLGRRSPHLAAAADLASLSCNKNDSNSSGWTPGWTPRHNYDGNNSREQRYCCHYFWSDLIDDENTDSQSKPVWIYRTRCCSGRSLIQHDGGHLQKFLPSWLLCSLVCNNSSSLSVLSLNHEYLFTRRALWTDHAIKAIKHLQTSHGKQIMRLESTAQRRDKEDLVMVGCKAIKVKKSEKYVRVGGENREGGRCRCCRDT